MITKIPAEDRILRAAAWPDELERFASQVDAHQPARLNLRPLAVGF